MNSEPEESMLDRNLRRLLGACDPDVDRSCRDFLRRLESEPAGQARSWAWLPLAAGLLVCAAILWVIVATRPAPEETQPAARQDGQDVKAQIAKLEAALKQTADEKERARIQAALDELRREKKKPVPPEPEKKTDTGKYDELTKAIEKNPRDASLYVARAEEGLWWKRWAEAETDCRKAIELTPASGRAHYVLGRALFFLRRTPEAKAAYARAVELDSALADVARIDAGEERVLCIQDELLDIYGRMKMSQDANERSMLEEKAQKLEQELKSIAAGMPPPVDIQEVEKRLQANPKDVSALVDRARWHIDAGSAASALKDLDRAIELKPDHAPALLARAVARAMSGQIDKAWEDCKRAMVIDPKNLKAIEHTQIMIKKLAAADKERNLAPDEVRRRIAALQERLDELRAMERNGDLSTAERERAGQDAGRVEAEIDRLKKR